MKKSNGIRFLIFLGVFASVLVFLASANLVSAQQRGSITTVVGMGPNNVPAVLAPVDGAQSVAIDSSGNIYIAASGLDRIFKVDSLGTLTLFAGTGVYLFNGDGIPAINAGLNGPCSIALDANGNLFISEWGNRRIRRIDRSTGIISTVAGTGGSGCSGDGGPAINATMTYPRALAIDYLGNVFIADYFDHRIRRVDAGTGVITTVAGNGIAGYSGDGGRATGASLKYPSGVAVDNQGNIFIADRDNHRIRRVDIYGTITTFAGNGTQGFFGNGGPASSASLSIPEGVVVGSSGDIYIADSGNHCVRRVDTAGIISGVVNSIAYSGYSGDGGPASDARLVFPVGITLDGAGDMFIADSADHRVRRVGSGGDGLITGATNETITTVAGNGTYAFYGEGVPAIGASIHQLMGLSSDSEGNIYFVDGWDYRVRGVDSPSGIITTIAGNGIEGFRGDGGPATAASIRTANGVAVDSDKNVIIADSTNARIRRVSAASGVITTIAGNGTYGFSGDEGPASDASFRNPQQPAIDADGNLYIADKENFRVRRVNSAGIITTVAGNGTYGFSGDGGLATAASMSYVEDVAVDLDGNLYVADTENNRIRKIHASTGVIETIAGNGIGQNTGDGGLAIDAGLHYPLNVAVDGQGNLYVQCYCSIRRVDAATGIIRTIAGTGMYGFSPDGWPATSMQVHPYSIALDGMGRLYFGDSFRIRFLTLARPPVANAGPDVSETPGTQIQFNGNASNSPDGTITSYRWDFGDGSKATGALTNHAYTSSGTFIASLLVFDNLGGVAKDTLTITVTQNQPPEAEAGPDKTLSVNQLAQFDGNGSSDPDGTIESYQWNFGDGVTATGATATHAYSSKGTFTVTLTVTDDKGATGTDTLVASIVNYAPIANAGPDMKVIACEPASFNGNGSSDPDGTIASYQWNFGDGKTANGIQASHAYKTAGVYSVTLTVTDNFGATATDTATVTVITMSNALQILIDLVASFNLQQGVNNSLDVKLQRAREAQEAVNANQRQDAQNHIDAFMNEVNAQRGKALTEAQANQLIYWALRIKTVIVLPGC